MEDSARGQQSLFRQNRDTVVDTPPEHYVAPPRDLHGPPSDREQTIGERFEAFHYAHPEVYTDLVALARQGVSAGEQRIGMKQLFEVLRWNRTIEGLPAHGEEFKLNNDFTSRYARMIMSEEPDLDELFEVRELLAR